METDGSPSGQKILNGRAPSTSRQRCSGCGRCVAACPLRLYTLELGGRRKLALKKAPEKCTACRKCTLACPLGLLVACDSKYADDVAE